MRRNTSPRTCTPRGNRSASSCATVDLPDAEMPVTSTTACSSSNDTCADGASAGAAAFALVVEEVDEHVVAEAVGVGEERAPTVDPHHLLDERAEVVTLVEHEGVDADAVARAPHHFLQRLLDRDR